MVPQRHRDPGGRRDVGGTGGERQGPVQVLRRPCPDVRGRAGFHQGRLPESVSMSELTEETVKALVWAIDRLTDEISSYRKIKERGIRLAETIEDERTRQKEHWAYP